jgi:cytochrome P450
LCSAPLERGRLDVIADLAQWLPVRVATRLLGFRECDAVRLAQLSTEAFGIFTQPLTLRRYQAIDRCVRELHGIVARLLEEDRRRPAGGLASALLAEQDAGRLGEADTLAFCSLLLSVGQDTTQNLIGNAVHAMSEHPAELKRLCAEPSLLTSAVRELARFNSPVQLVVRIASTPMDIGGCRIESGERVHVFLGAALRDPAVFASPDVLDIRRPPGNPLPFGAGRHFCLGFHLAQLEAELALEHLLPHLQRLQPAASPEWFRSVHMRGLKSLVLTLPQRSDSTC